MGSSYLQVAQKRVVELEAKVGGSLWGLQEQSGVDPEGDTGTPTRD